MKPLVPRPRPTRLTTAGVGILASITIAACGSTSPSGPSQSTGGGPSGTLTYSLATLPHGLNPYLQFSGFQGLLWTNPLYDTLTILNPQDTVQPDLATSWTVGSDSKGPYLDLTLRQGLKFPDGAPFDSDTVAASINLAQTLPGSFAAPDLTGVTVDKLSSSKVRLYSAAAIALPTLLAGPAGQMISQKAISGGMDLTTHSDGIGMFTLQSYTPPQVTYTANPTYWDPSAVRIKTLVIIGSSDDNARLNLMHTQGLDITYLVPALDASAAGLGYTALTAPFLDNYGFAINTSVHPFNDIRVRQALSMAIDRDTICKTVFFSECTVDNQIYPTTDTAYNPSVPATQYDPGMAKSLLQQAGAVGTKFTLINTAGVSKFTTMGAAIQAEWDAAGFNVTLLNLPGTETSTAFGTQHRAPVSFISFGAYSDPSQAVTTYLSKTALRNPGGFDNPQIDALAVQGLQGTDPRKRTAIYQQISALAANDLVDIIIQTASIKYWVLPRVHGFQGPLGPADPYWRGVSVSS